MFIIPINREFLLEYINTPPSPNEIRESVDMLRILDNGGKVLMVETYEISHPVDIPDDINVIENLIAAFNVKYIYLL